MQATADFETYSEAGYVWDDDTNKWTCLPNAPQSKKGLEVVSIAVYATHPSTEVLVFGYTLPGQGPKQWAPGMPNPTDLFDYIARGGKIAAWNSAFEWWVWNHVCVPKYGWPLLAQDSMQCSMARARAHALPGSLKNAGAFLHLGVTKDADGDRLLKKFSVPQNPTKKRPQRRFHPSDDLVDWAKLCAYNAGDLAAEAAVDEHTPPLSPLEERYWRDDQRINARGVAVDVPLIDACCAIITQALDRYTPEMQQLTGGIRPTEVQQLLGWMHGLGVHLDALDEDAIEEALKRDLPPAVRRVMQIRALVASASVKKVFLMRLQVSRWGRLHDLYTFYGTRTGRPTGNGPQPTNLPKAGPKVYQCASCTRFFGKHHVSCPWCATIRAPTLRLDEWSPEAMDDAIVVLMTGNLDAVEWFFGDALKTVAGCLRGVFIAEPGNVLISSDYSAIEGVVIAMLANEQWRIDVFRTHGRIYETSASKIFGIPFEDFTKHRVETKQHHPMRQYGKIAELALGFMGWINAWREFDGPGTDEEIKHNILAWRAASPAIVHFAGGQSRNFQLCEPYGCEGMAVRAMESPGIEFPVLRLDGTPSGVSYIYRKGTLYCHVPSGGRITYHHARLDPPGDYEWRGKQIRYEGWNTNPKQGPIGWVELSLYAGKLVENVVQKVARDIQMHAIEHCEDTCYPVVLHTYDEIVSEVRDEPRFTVDDFEARMNALPPWAADWPVKASGGWRGKRYRKA